MGRNFRPLADIEADLIATTDPDRHAAPPEAELTREQVTAALVALLDRSGYARLEIVRAGRGVSGYCIDGNREGFHIGRAAELAEQFPNP